MYKSSVKWLERNNDYRVDVDSAYATHRYYQNLENNWRVRDHVVHDAKKDFYRRFTKRLFKFYGENTKDKLRKDYGFDSRGRRTTSRSLASEKKYESEASRLRFAIKPRIWKGYVFMRLKNHHFEVSGLIDLFGDHQLSFYQSLHSLGMKSGLEYEAAGDQIKAKLHKPIDENWAVELYQTFANKDEELGIPSRDTGFQFKYAVNF